MAAMLDDFIGPVKIIHPNEDDRSFELNEDQLSNILLNPKYADKKVALVSVAGAFRKGKSFILNFFLRYLTWKESGQENTDWLTSADKLEGFSWRGGSERETEGILIWSKPFIIKDKNGEDVVVFLMDTQGAFDSLSTVKDCATVFALSTMLSSIQIYNISQNIQEDDLQHLQLFSEYGKLALEECEGKPFQSLLFLVRDWSYPYDADYGFLGGQRILDKRLEQSEKQHSELRQLRQHIRDSFENIQCFLMPHPGLEVARKQQFKGELEDIDATFLSNLRVFVPRLFDSNTITPKVINGQPITCRELLEYFKMYITIFHGEDMPEPKSMLEATAEANNLAAVALAKAQYVHQMEDICGGGAPYINTETLEKEHQNCLNSAIQCFKKTRKMGGSEFSLKYVEKLENELIEQFGYFAKANENKNLFKSMRTPAVLTTLIVADYCFQEFFQFIGLEGIAGIFTSICFIAIIALISWIYVRYSGNVRELGQGIDNGANWIWKNFLSQIMVPATHAGINLATNVTQKKYN
uniref:GB1/RHD3-type G domain-containing protein n=1 Tax=Panagrolaimus sp. JU765 TaxID=591449 RepID=A0AC34QAN8_9BILA